MSKASKLARAQKNVPAVSQRILTKANKWINSSNTSLQSTNTHDPVKGTYNDTNAANAAFFLVEEATNGYANNIYTTPDTGEKMFIDDLQLSYNTSYVRLTVSFNGDTDNGNVCNVLKIQKSTSGATEYDSTGWADIHVSDAFTGSAGGAQPRIQAATATGYSQAHRSIENGNIRVIDKTPGILTPRYRVLLHVYPGYYSYLNRDFDLDNVGSGIGIGSTHVSVPRTISTFTAEEIINY